MTELSPCSIRLSRSTFPVRTPDSVFLLLIYRLFPRHKFRINFLVTPVPILAITLVFFLFSGALTCARILALAVWFGCPRIGWGTAFMWLITKRGGK